MMISLMILRGLSLIRPNDRNIPEPRCPADFLLWTVKQMTRQENSVKYYIDGTFLLEYTSNVPTAPDALHLLFRDKSQTDWVFVRKYTTSEPVATLGAESANPAVDLTAGTAYFWRVQY
jgi:hypothetical protein